MPTKQIKPPTTKQCSPRALFVQLSFRFYGISIEETPERTGAIAARIFHSHQLATVRRTNPTDTTRLMSTSNSPSSFPGRGMIFSRGRYKAVLSPVGLSARPPLFLTWASAWSMNSSACAMAELQTPQA